jgi:hypothetical protein
MPMLRLKMAAFMVMLAMAPAAAANQPEAGAKHDRSACTHNRARAGGAGGPAVAVTPPRKLAVRTVIVKGSGGGLSTWGHIAADLMP